MPTLRSPFELLVVIVAQDLHRKGSGRGLYEGSVLELQMMWSENARKILSNATHSSVFFLRQASVAAIGHASPRHSAIEERNSLCLPLHPGPGIVGHSDQEPRNRGRGLHERRFGV